MLQAAVLTFNSVTLTPIQHNSQNWFTSSDLAKALGYAHENAVTKIFNRNQDEFTAMMAVLLPEGQIGSPGESSGLQRFTRLFSLRGCHLIAMYARTEVAKQFRAWVLDILDELANKDHQFRTQLEAAQTSFLITEAEKMNTVKFMTYFNLLKKCGYIFKRGKSKWMPTKKGLDKGIVELKLVNPLHPGQLHLTALGLSYVTEITMLEA